MLDLDSSLASALVNLGMPQYDPESKSASTRLLDALAAATQTSEIRDDNVFLGQVRGAWASFVPDTNQKFPSQLLVKGAGRRLSVVTPTIDVPVYLPDSSRSSLAALDQFNIPVLAIEASDAKEARIEPRRLVPWCRSSDFGSPTCSIGRRESMDCRDCA